MRRARHRPLVARALPAGMRCVVFTGVGGREVVAVTDRPDPEPAKFEVRDRAAVQRRQPGRRAPARGPAPGAAGIAGRRPRARGGRHGGRVRRRRHRVRSRRPRLRAGRRRRTRHPGGRQRARAGPGARGAGRRPGGRGSRGVPDGVRRGRAAGRPAVRRHAAGQRRQRRRRHGGRADRARAGRAGRRQRAQRGGCDRGSRSWAPRCSAPTRRSRVSRELGGADVVLELVGGPHMAGQHRVARSRRPRHRGRLQARRRGRDRPARR